MGSTEYKYLCPIECRIYHDRSASANAASGVNVTLDPSGENLSKKNEKLNEKKRKKETKTQLSAPITQSAVSAGQKLRLATFSSHRRPYGTSDRIMADKQPSVAPGPAPSEASHVQQDRLNRGLSARQVQMIAIGGTIGTGLFLGTGSSLATGGPASMLIASAISGGIIFVTMLSLGEMAAFVPVAGSFCTFAGCVLFYYIVLETNSVQEIRRRRVWVCSNLELLVQ